MKNKKLIVLGLSLLGLICFNNAFSQCRSEDPNKRRPFYEVEAACAIEHSESSYLSDGKDHRALLSGAEIAEFVVTFFAGNKYRIAACTGVGGPLSFTVLDHLGNLLFTNKEHENAPYWDLEFPITIESKIVIQLPPETIELAGASGAATTAPPEEGKEAPVGEDTTKKEKEKKSVASRANKSPPVCAVLLIGYKQE